MVLLLDVGVDAEVGAQLLADVRGQVEGGGVAFGIFGVYRTVFARITHGAIVACGFRTAGEAHRVRVRHGIAAHEVEPVGVGRFVVFHFVEELLVGDDSCLKAVESTFVSHHRHVLRKYVMQVA